LLLVLPKMFARFDGDCKPDGIAQAAACRQDCPHSGMQKQFAT
jgi:hypothetical protein